MPLINPAAPAPMSGIDLSLTVPATNCLAKLVALSVTTTVDPYTALVTSLNTQGIIVYDSFNRVNDALSLGSADTGQAWTPEADRGIWGISSNKAYVVTHGVLKNRIMVDSGISDGVIQVTVVKSGSDPKLVARAIDSENAIEFGYGTAGGKFTILKRVAGVATMLGENTATLNNGAIFKVVMNGANLKFYVDNSLILEVDETFNQTVTKIGLGCFAGGSDSSEFDNILMEAS